MSRTISRKTKMTEKIVFRGHPEDVANIKLAAQQLGMDSSAFLRYLLIKERIISPV